jgi:multiple sugar transport system substrate-binding protein
MAFYYNTKLLAKYHITPPTTWAEFAADAAKLHKANPSAYMTNFSAIDLQWVMSLMAQDNAWPFAYSGGSNVTINWTGPKQMAFASYWQNLLSAHEVNATTNVAANWGGSTYPVFTQSKHPKEAAEFSEWLNATDASWNITKTAPSSLFPTYLPLLNSASYKNITVPLSGSSTPGVQFTAAASQIQGVPWPPFMTEALTQSATVFAGVMNGKQTLQTAFKNFQNVLVTYAKAQGFTVST